MKKRWLRAVALLTAVVLAIGLLTACGQKQSEPLVTLGDTQISLNTYELLCSRLKGTLGKSQLNVSNPDFWSTVMDKQNTTADEYYRNTVLETCKSYAAALHLFDELGLSLPESTYTEIDTKIAEFLDYHAENSKSAFNSILAAYGVNMTMLREVYVMEEKVKYLEDTLYGANGSKISAAVCEEFCAENYFRFKQVFLANYYYVYEKDKNGDEIWYHTDKGAIAYDTVHGVTRSGMVDDANNKIYYCNPLCIAYDTKTGVTVKGVNGETYKDSNNQEIYYTNTSGTRIAYDTKNGVTHEGADGQPKKDENGDVIYYLWEADAYDRIAYLTTGENIARGLTTDSTGAYVTKKYTAAEVAAISERAQTLLSSIREGDTGAFEGLIDSDSDDTTGQTDYANGYYLNKQTTYPTAYLNDIVKALQEMKPGDVRLIMSEDTGYHIIMKYEMNEGAYSDSANKFWFSDFSTLLISELFSNKIAPYLEKITVHEDVYKKAMTMAEIGVNYYY